MGFFIRKSKNFGGLRLNLSKSGLGFSVGVKGLRFSLNKKGVQMNAGRQGFYYRKSWSKKACQEKQGVSNEIPVEIPAEEVIQEKPKAKIISKSPEQENFEGVLALFTLGFIFAFIGLFFKFWLACLFGVLVAISRNIYIKKNPEKYAIYKENPDPQLYYIGKTKSQIEELKKQAEENNLKIQQEEQQKRNSEKHAEHRYN